ncbi:MAG: pyridoxamine 5'-phosphate oxidase family protein, partial [Candidatus Korarchaeota archaeon]
MIGKYPPWMGKMRGLTRKELAQFLARGYVARIATIKKDGSPYIVPAWFQYEEPYFYFVARAKSIWVEHIKNDPRVAVQISRDDPPYTRVLVEGFAEIVEGPVVGGRWVEIAHKMALRYLGD